MNSTSSWFSQTFGFVRGNILVLTISGSLGMFSRSMVFPYVPLYVLSLGGDPEQVGIVYALGPLGGLLMFPIAGYLADHMNRPRLIALAGYFSAVMLLINAVAPTWEWVAAARLLQGLAVFHFPASSALIADARPPQPPGRGLATKAALAGTVARFAPYLAGTTLDAWGVERGMRILYVAMAAAYAGGATINLLFLKETRQVSPDRVRMDNLAQTFRGVYADIVPMLRGFSPALKAMSVIVTLCFVCNGLAGPFWVVYVTTEVGLSSSQWGLILLVEAGLRNLSTIPAGFLVDHFGRRRFILMVLLFSWVIPLLLLAGSFAQVLVLRCVIGIISAFFSPAMGALMADIVPSENRGRVMAAIGRGTVMVGGATGGIGGPGVGFLTTLPLIIGSACGGILYAISPSIPFLFVLGAMVVAFALAVGFLHEPKNAEL
ncbi:MAG: MFS transporter [Candidatus Latescibacterota bacterium]|nr:MFS transporter [Candidatus Latescibacterota bacterium]